jgi:hypothetical protein
VSLVMAKSPGASGFHTLVLLKSNVASEVSADFEVKFRAQLATMCLLRSGGGGRTIVCHMAHNLLPLS